MAALRDEFNGATFSTFVTATVSCYDAARFNIPPLACVSFLLSLFDECPSDCHAHLALGIACAYDGALGSQWIVASGPEDERLRSKRALRLAIAAIKGLATHLDCGDGNVRIAVRKAICDIHRLRATFEMNWHKCKRLRHPYGPIMKQDRRGAKRLHEAVLSSLCEGSEDSIVAACLVISYHPFYSEEICTRLLDLYKKSIDAQSVRKHLLAALVSISGCDRRLVRQIEDASRSATSEELVALCALPPRMGDGGYELTPLITELARPLDSDARGSVAVALSRFGSGVEHLLPWLVEAFSKEHCNPVPLAKAMLRIGEAGVRALVKVAKGSDSVRRDGAVRAMSQSRFITNECVPLLRNALSSENDEVKENAAVCIARLGPAASATIPALIEMLSSDSGRCGEYAAVALGRIGAAAVIAIPSLAEAIRRPGVREAASDAIATLLPLADGYTRDESDQEILAWFESVNVPHRDSYLRTFWCIGKLDCDSLMCGDKAMGFQTLERRFRQLQALGRLDLQQVGQSHLRKVIEELESIFNCHPFPIDAWTAEETAPDFRRAKAAANDSGRRERADSRWTARAKRAWLYIDRYLRLKAMLPRMIVDPVIFEGSR